MLYVLLLSTDADVFHEVAGRKTAPMHGRMHSAAVGGRAAKTGKVDTEDDSRDP